MNVDCLPVLDLYSPPSLHDEVVTMITTSVSSPGSASPASFWVELCGDKDYRDQVKFLEHSVILSIPQFSPGGHLIENRQLRAGVGVCPPEVDRW